MLYRFLSPLVSLVLPPTCCLCDSTLNGADGSIVCDPCRLRLVVFPDPRGLAGEGPLDRLWAIGPYEGRLKEAVVRLKFKGRRGVARLIPLLLKEVAPLMGRYDGIFPVPLHPRRARERGYNQAALLAVAMGEILACPVDAGALRKTRIGVPQVGLSEAERKGNVKGSIEVGRGVRQGLEEGDFLIVDDVTTTGATLSECARVLKKAGARKADGFVLARTM